MNKYYDAWKAIWDRLCNIGLPREHVHSMNELLDKTIPMKVKNKKQINYFYQGNCGKCNHIVEKVQRKYLESVYCPKCGQKLDWSDKND